MFAYANAPRKCGHRITVGEPPDGAETPAGAALLAARDDPTGPAGPPGTATTAPPPAAPATAGDPCGWQQEGDVATATDGRTVTCVRIGDRYRWQIRWQTR